MGKAGEIGSCVSSYVESLRGLKELMSGVMMLSSKERDSVAEDGNLNKGPSPRNTDKLREDNSSALPASHFFEMAQVQWESYGHEWHAPRHAE